MLRRSFILSNIFIIHLQKARSSTAKHCVTYIPAGAISPHFANVIGSIGSYNCLVTHESPEEEEVNDTGLNQILATIKDAPKSTREVCTAYIDSQCKAGNLSAAVRLLHSLHNEKIFLGPNVYNLVLTAAGERNDVEVLLMVFKDLVVSYQSVPSSSFSIMAKALLKIADNDYVQLLRLVKDVSELTYPRSILVINRIIFAFGECGQFDKALVVFDQMKGLECKPDLVTYNTVLDILGHAGQIDRMLSEFAYMKEAGILPDFISYNTILNQLRKVGRMDLCLVYCREMGQYGIEPDLLTYTALIQSLGRAGNVEESLRLFHEMKRRQIRPSVYVYRSIISSLKKAGKTELALAFMEEMNASPLNLAGPKDFKRKEDS